MFLVLGCSMDKRTVRGGVQVEKSSIKGEGEILIFICSGETDSARGGECSRPVWMEEG